MGTAALSLPAESPPTDVVTVAAYGRAERLADLLPYLPVDWRLIHGDRRDSPDLVLLYNATGERVAEARRRDPGAGVVAVLDPRGDQQEVVCVLNAGADACVRSTSSAIIAAHLQACRRRQLAS
jgi:hypothetical protein